MYRPGGTSKNSSGSALIVLGVRHGVIERYPRSVLDGIHAAVTAARSAGMPILFVRAACRTGHGALSASKVMVAAFRESCALLLAQTVLPSGLSPGLGERLIWKSHASELAGTDLDPIVAEHAVRRLVLCGVATSGLVLAAVRAGADRGLELTVLSDACADGDPESHAALMERELPLHASVLDVASWRAHL